MSVLRLVALTVLLLASPLLPGAEASAPNRPPAAVEAVAGRGVWGSLACYACLGAAIGSSVYIGPASAVILAGCGDLCSVAL